MGVVPFRLLEGLLNQIDLQGLGSLLNRVFFFSDSRQRNFFLKFLNLGRQILSFNFRLLCQYNRPLNRILQLPHISKPPIIDQFSRAFGWIPATYFPRLDCIS